MSQSHGENNVHLVKEAVAIDGMSCDHCKNAVEKAVRQLPGVIRADVDLAAKTLTVEYDGGKVGQTAIKLAVEEEGFSVAG